MMILLKMLLASIVGILGLSAVLIGIFSFFFMPEPNYLFSFGFLIGGLILGPSSFWYISRMNRFYQDQELKEVLENPERILAQWENEEDRIILTKDELFIGDRLYAFKTYQKLKAAELIEKEGVTELRFEFQIIGKASYQPPALFITVPPAMLTDAKVALQAIQQQYLLA